MAATPSPGAAGPGSQSPAPRDDEHPDDRALDRLADRGPSRVGVDGALRARDVSRPTPAQFTQAQRGITIRRARPVDT